MGRYQLLLPPETYCQTNENEGIHHWTNVIKEETTAKLTQEEAGDNELLSCLTGFISKQNGKTTFNITRRLCDDTMEYFMCRTETALSTTSRRSLIDIDIPEKVSSTTMNIDEASITTSSQSVPELVTMTMTKDSSASFHTGPVIGGIAGAITILAVLSCGFFKTTNTDKRGVQFTTAVNEHSQNPAVRTSGTASSNESYGIASINSINTYAVVNKIKKMESKLQESDETYTETLDGEYDRLNAVSKRRTDSKKNLYDSHAGIRNENDPTYDSSNIGGRNLQFDNDVYDHTDTVSTEGSDYGYSLILKSETRNEKDVYDKTL
ncbi:unnamed protein product [Mytilus coruscus]|uniref:Uncharacterized protein n=1 Tax=Mytilus coruscus TaxID=42192 RepID=A0A6J8ES16_MYTCO|nr:unnamed protein product [Mytilus coruscus]